jgi:hypothetical protein
VRGESAQSYSFHIEQKPVVSGSTKSGGVVLATKREERALGTVCASAQTHISSPREHQLLKNIFPLSNKAWLELIVFIVIVVAVWGAAETRGYELAMEDVHNKLRRSCHSPYVYSEEFFGCVLVQPASPIEIAP